MTISNLKYQKSKIQIKVKKFGFWSVILIFAVCSLSFSGCAAIKEGGRCLIGVSTKEVERSRSGAITKSFNYDYNACYSKTKGILKNIGSYIYAQNKNMIAIYISEEDTTPVGLFFKEVDANNTQIEVSSPSTYAKELIAAKVFSALEGEAHEKKE